MLYADATRTNHDPLTSRGIISVLGALLLRPSDALASASPAPSPPRSA